MNLMSLTDTPETTSTSAQSAAASERRLFGLPFTFASFLIVGATAFFVNLIALFLLYDTSAFWFLPDKEADWGLAGVEHPDIRLLIASVVAVEVAIAWKFVLYEHWTFSDRPRRGNIVWRFVQLNIASALATFVTLATVNVLTPLLGIVPYITTAIGVLVAFMLNWVFSNHFIWRAHGSPAA